ncbi:MFS transporter [Limosilactobacillus urinaemulieris]|uniref:MFS transporter n=1 Tax=Limosilactobacillus urinaemulieris TaxID=2742600 RepID=UPI002E285BA4|nr:MFS transporter [Limosilactobacillus urinaemulieris]
MDESQHLMSQNERPKSYRTLVLVFLGFIICFIDRSAMNIALAYVGKSFTLTPAQLGVVGSAFFFSYSLVQVPGGWLVDRFGTKWMTVLSLLAWSVFTVMTGFAWSFTSLIIIRVLFGIGEGSYPSAAMKQVRLAFPENKRGQASAVGCYFI